MSWLLFTVASVVAAPEATLDLDPEVHVVVHGERILELDWTDRECRILGVKSSAPAGVPAPLGVEGWGHQRTLVGFSARDALHLEFYSEGPFRSDMGVPFYQVRSFTLDRRGVETAAIPEIWDRLLAHCSLLGLPSERYLQFATLRRSARRVMVQLVLQEIFVRRECIGERGLFSDARRCAHRGRCEDFSRRIASADYCPSSTGRSVL